MFRIKFKHIFSLYPVNFQNTSNHQILFSMYICVYLPNSDQMLVAFCQQSLQPLLGAYYMRDIFYFFYKFISRKIF